MSIFKKSIAVFICVTMFFSSLYAGGSKVKVDKVFSDKKIAVVSAAGEGTTDPKDKTVFYIKGDGAAILVSDEKHSLKEGDICYASYTDMYQTKVKLYAPNGNALYFYDESNQEQTSGIRTWNTIAIVTAVVITVVIIGVISSIGSKVG